MRDDHPRWWVPTNLDKTEYVYTFALVETPKTNADTIKSGDPTLKIKAHSLKIDEKIGKSPPWTTTSGSGIPISGHACAVLQFKMAASSLLLMTLFSVPGHSRSRMPSQAIIPQFLSYYPTQAVSLITTDL